MRFAAFARHHVDLLVAVELAVNAIVRPSGENFANSSTPRDDVSRVAVPPPSGARQRSPP
jgi:hypothetical protein